MRVTRSLTIKQMAIVSAVTLTILSLFILLQLFHFVQQRRVDYAQQMENVAHTIRQPLSEALARADNDLAKHILVTLKLSGVITRADVVSPNHVQVLQNEYAKEKSVPALIAQLFDLPVVIRVPLYSPEPAIKGPLAFLVLKADSARMYQFIRTTVATMLIAYLLLALVLTVAISWSINRLLVRPVRHLALALKTLAPQDLVTHQLPLLSKHRNDELGQLIMAYNQHQQTLGRMYNETNCTEMPHALTCLPEKSFFLALIEWQLKSVENLCHFAIMVLRVETLQSTQFIVNQDQRNMLLMKMVNRICDCTDEHSSLAQMSHCDFALLIKHAYTPFHAMCLAKKMMHQLTQPVIQGKLQLHPEISIGIALHSKATQHAEALLNRASSAMMSAHHYGKNQIRLFGQTMKEKA